MMEPITLYTHGKLLLTGEYFVLDGAASLAIPTRYGQRFSVLPMEKPTTHDLSWSMSNVTAPGEVSNYALYAGEWSDPTVGDDPVRSRLLQLFGAAEQLRPGCTGILKGKRIDCYLEFDPDWGLGSSSTLLAFLADLLSVNAYELLTAWIGGSGYDIACATADGPLLYRRGEGSPTVTSLDWNPGWLRQTYFVHLNRKQNSREGIASYRKAMPTPDDLEAISQLSLALTDPSLHLRAAAQLLERHETMISNVLGLPRVREQFPDFPGTLKSLGAWGGDFTWAISEEPAEKVRAYFNERGYGTFIPYHDMIL